MIPARWFTFRAWHQRARNVNANPSQRQGTDACIRASFCSLIPFAALLGTGVPGCMFADFRGPRREKPAARRRRRRHRDWPMYGGTPSRNMVNPVAKGLPTDWEHEGRRQERQVGRGPGRPRLPAAGRRGRQGLHLHQQPQAARQGGQGRQGRPHVLQRGRRQVPLADRPRHAAGGRGHAGQAGRAAVHADR